MPHDDDICHTAAAQQVNAPMSQRPAPSPIAAGKSEIDEEIRSVAMIRDCNEGFQQHPTVTHTRPHKCYVWLVIWERN